MYLLVDASVGTSLVGGSGATYLVWDALMVAGRGGAEAAGERSTYVWEVLVGGGEGWKPYWGLGQARCPAGACCLVWGGLWAKEIERQQLQVGGLDGLKNCAMSNGHQVPHTGIRIHLGVFSTHAG